MIKKEHFKNANFQRMGLVVLAVLLQLTLVILLSRLVRDGAVYIYALVEILAVIEIFSLVSQSRSRDYTISWVLVIAFLPITGYILYLLWGRSGPRGAHREALNEATERSQEYLTWDENICQEFDAAYPQYSRIAEYLKRKDFPLYKNTKIDYFPLGELHFAAMLEDIKKAKEFIFLEYFIIGDGEIWQKFEDALIAKAKEGLEIKILFDDMGCLTTLRDSFITDMEAHGIRAVRFNPIHKYISRLYINYRNHQKIAVIDGQIGYTGGTNISDEYANVFPKHGHWKDSAIRLEGDAVWGLTMTFLTMWDGQTREKSDFLNYKRSNGLDDPNLGFVQPFADGPLNNPDNPAEFMYRNIISRAQKYVYMSTPYLVIDSAMLEALIGAAESGVDVRVITPKVGDYWSVHGVTRSNYRELLRAGAKVYEYTPGYIHAKTIISDDQHGITGSINMDYRSFNLNFENGVWMCGTPVLATIKEDFLQTIAISEEIDYQEYMNRPFYVKAMESFLRVFAVLF